MKIFGFDSRYVRTALVASFVAAVSLGAFAQDAAPSSTPAAAIGYFPYSTITSANDTIYATQLPVTYNGKTYYEDATILLSFEVNATTGEVTATAAPSFVKSPSVPTNHFKPGTYVGPSNINGGKNIIVVSGPSSLPGGGSEWTLALGSSANAGTYPSTANWYVVSTLSDNPGYSRLKAAGITSTDYSYGI